MEIWTALAIGFLGSFHCIGMCGPIALALPGSGRSGFNLVWGRVVYNMGRIVTYSLLGALFGVIGHSFALAGFQKALSVVLGVLIILSIFLKSDWFSDIKKKLRINTFYTTLKRIISNQFRKKGESTLFIIGILNGLLPCGLVYIGLAGSLTIGSIAGGSIFMALFGLGTFPVMMAMSLAPGLISIPLRQRINKAIPIFAALFGIYLIYRGLFIQMTGF